MRNTRSRNLQNMTPSKNLKIKNIEIINRSSQPNPQDQSQTTNEPPCNQSNRSQVSNLLGQIRGSNRVRSNINNDINNINANLVSEVNDLMGSSISVDNLSLGANINNNTTNVINNIETENNFFNNNFN